MVNDVVNDVWLCFGVDVGNVVYDFFDDVELVVVVVDDKVVF